MLGNVTSLTGHGLKDWLVQRATAVVMAIYAIILFYFIFKHTPMSYVHWQQFMTSSWVRIANTLILTSLLLHAWIGFWTVTTDYLKKSCLRVSVQLVVLFALLALFVWGIYIFWGI